MNAQMIDKLRAQDGNPKLLLWMVYNPKRSSVECRRNMREWRARPEDNRVSGSSNGRSGQNGGGYQQSEVQLD